jgi:hypothetical protein
MEYVALKSGTSAWFLSFLENAKEELLTVPANPRTPDGKASVWPFIVLVVIVAVVAWAAYAYFVHSGPLPNFHW